MGLVPRILKVARLFTRQHKMNIVSMANVHNAGVGNEGVVYEKDYIYIYRFVHKLHVWLFFGLSFVLIPSKAFA